MSGKIFVTGDTHGYTDIDKIIRFSKRHDLTSDDVLIICGDFGLVWSESQSEMEWRKWYSEQPFTTLFIAGNHENYNLLNKLPHYDWKGNVVRYVSNNLYYLTNGLYTINNKNVFVIGGAESHDKGYRVKGIDWWEQEIPSATQLGNLQRIINSTEKNIDIILSHCAPDWIQEWIYPDYPINRLTTFLDNLSETVDYKEWCCGHYHQDKDIEIDDNKHFHILYDRVLEII